MHPMAAGRGGNWCLRGLEDPRDGHRTRVNVEGYAWPGNIRELRNLTERAAVLCRGGIVGPSFVRSLLPTDVEPRATDLDLERRMILDALAATGDDKLAAAKRLGIGERTLWTKLKKQAI
jgi:two-component system, NtrC family, response regulator AtoC